ncbi:hypothetical protein [Devosia elaeis]|nr:hypothetical protein [Devosia elaeis]
MKAHTSILAALAASTMALPLMSVAQEVTVSPSWSRKGRTSP